MPSGAIELKSAGELALMREAGRIVQEVLLALREAARPGTSTLELDALAESITERRGARPAFKGYLGFPRSLCASLNDEVVHGIPSANRKLKEGDLLKLDYGVIFKGFYGDAALTVGVGKVSAAAERLMQATRESLYKAIAQVRPGARVSDLGAAVQGHVEPLGYSVVRDFVGHGVGRALHEAPQVPNYRGSEGPDPRLKPGMVIAIEPMVNAGGYGVKTLADRWTAVTLDGSLSAHFEHTVAVTEGGAQVLTDP